MPDINRNGKLDPEEEMLEEIMTESLAEPFVKNRSAAIVLIALAVIVIIALLVLIYKVA